MEYLSHFQLEMVLHQGGLVEGFLFLFRRATLGGIVPNTLLIPVRLRLAVLWLSIGTLRSDDSDGNGNATKAIGLISKTIILHVHHAFL